MCMLDDSEPWAFSRDAHPVAQIAHPCGECGRRIEPGERYRRFEGLYDGRFSTIKQCGQCEAAAGWLLAICSGYLFHAVAEDLGEHRWELGASVALGRLIVGMRRRWRRPSGDLWPVETVEEWTADAIRRWREVAAAHAARAAERRARWEADHPGLAAIP